jgi:nitrous oxidase accessory protein NosD
MGVFTGSGRGLAGVVLGASGLVAAGVLAAAPASAQPLTCGTTLTASVTLTANLDCSADTTGSALIIGAPGVTVNLAGHKILGPGAVAETNAIDDSAGYSGPTVEYGTLSNFSYGVVADGSSTAPLTGLLVKKITTTSDAPATGYGVYGEYLSEAGIHGVTAYNASDAIVLDHSQDSTVSYNRLVTPGTACMTTTGRTTSGRGTP